MKDDICLIEVTENGLTCFKVTIFKDSQQVDVVCPWNSELLFNQVVNALNLGNKVIVDVYRLPIADEGEQ